MLLLTTDELNINRYLLAVTSEGLRLLLSATRDCGLEAVLESGRLSSAQYITILVVLV